MDPNRHPPALGRRPLGPRRLCLLNGNQDKMNPFREGERSPVGSSDLPGNRCPGPTAPIAVSHPQNTSPPINHSGGGEPVSFSCSDESDPRGGRGNTGRKPCHTRGLHTSLQLTVKVLVKTTTERPGLQPGTTAALPGGPGGIPTAWLLHSSVITPRKFGGSQGSPFNCLGILTP